MKRGDFAAAWAISDRLLSSHAAIRCDDLPIESRWVWTGEPLNGRRVLVRCYRGLGDTVQFARYVPRLRATAADTVLAAPRALTRLLATIDRIGPVLPDDPSLVDADYDNAVEIMELPHVFRTTLDTIPAQVPYLDVAPAPLPRGGSISVGIAWRSGRWDLRRSIPLRAVAAVVRRRQDIAWYALQRGASLRGWNESLGAVSPGADLYQEAQAIRSLDLVISVDSMQAHLAGALGVPTWTLLQHDADWRWLRDRDDTPWYPTMRLFRQPRRGDWTAVLERVEAELDALSRRPAPDTQRPRR
jgi:hypothetical protein